MNINKEFMPSVANTIGTDLTKYKVIKKNYLTLTPCKQKARKIHSALTNKDYELKPKTTVKVSVGEGFKSFVNVDKPMKDKLCRFVGSNNSVEETGKSN